MTIELYITIIVTLITLLPFIHLCFLFMLFALPKIIEGLYRLAIYAFQHAASLVLYIYILYIVAKVYFIIFYNYVDIKVEELLF